MADTIAQPQGLIRVLLDANAPFADRDDAAMDLAEFDGVEVERALAQVASDPQMDSDLVQTSAESLAEIWCRRNQVDWQTLSKLTPEGRQMAVAVLLAANPELKEAIAAKLAGTPSPQPTTPRPPKESH